MAGVAFVALVAGCRESAPNLTVEAALAAAPPPAEAVREVVSALARSERARVRTVSGKSALDLTGERTRLFPHACNSMVDVGGELIHSRTESEFDGVLHAWEASEGAREIHRTPGASPVPWAESRGQLYFRSRPDTPLGALGSSEPPVPLHVASLAPGKSLGKPKEFLARTNGLERMAFAGDWVYHSTGGGFFRGATNSRVRAHHRKTGEERVVQGPSAITVTSMVVHRGDLYWVEVKRGTGPTDYPPAYLVRYPLGPDGASRDAKPERIYESSDRPDGLAVLGDVLYLTTMGSKSGGLADGTLARWNSDSQKPEPLVQAVALPDDLVAVGTSHLCWDQAGDGGTIVVCYEPAKDALQIVARPGSTTMLFGPAAYKNQVVWSEWDLRDDQASGTFGLPLPPPK